MTPQTCAPLLPLALAVDPRRPGAMITYREALTQAMTTLSLHPRAVFLGQSIRDGGTAIILRGDALNLGLPRYFTGIPCVNGHICERIVSNMACSTCHRNRVKIVRARGGSRRVAFQIVCRANVKKRQAKGGSRRDYHKSAMKRWRKTSVNAILRKRLYDRFRDALNGNYKSGSAVRDLGCSIDDFKAYVAAKFVDGMTWDNYGAWHLDHIRPLASFDLADRNQFLEACHFSNYQPLWAADNLSKCDTWNQL